MTSWTSPRRVATPFLLGLLACAGSAGGSTAESVQEPAPERAAEAFDQAHGAWTAVLREHVRGDRFDYAGLKADPTALRAYLGELRAVTREELEAWTPAERFAFWINAYNAFTIEKVVDNYPLRSIRDLSKAFGLKSVFDEEFIPLARLYPKAEAERLSLNDIEHRILREEFKDARLHAAINCASIGCPPLRDKAFVAERLDEQLEAQMRSFVMDGVRNRLDREKGALELSQVFAWFGEDFERDAGSVAEFVARFVPEEVRAFVRAARIRHLDYDWDLNDVPGAK